MISKETAALSGSEIETAYESEGYDPSFSAVFQQLTNEVFRLSTQLQMLGDQMSKDLDLSTARWQVLAAIRTKPMTVADISRRLVLRRQSVRETVNRLNKQELVTLEDNPRHINSPLVQLTPAGQEIINTLRKRQLKFVETYSKELGFSTSHIQSMLDSVHKMREVAEKLDPIDFE